MVADYGRRLNDLVIPAVRAEIKELAGTVDGAVSLRAKDADGLLDKVGRMTMGTSGRPGREDYQVGDVVDAVGARITVENTERLEHVTSEILDRAGLDRAGEYSKWKICTPSPRSITRHIGLSRI